MGWDCRCGYVNVPVRRCRYCGRLHPWARWRHRRQQRRDARRAHREERRAARAAGGADQAQAPGPEKECSAQRPGVMTKARG